jgi:hypothetical protein
VEAVCGVGSKAGGSESRFAVYVEAITSVLGHADRAAPFQSYFAGLLLPGDRKSVEPMAAHFWPPSDVGVQARATAFPVRDKRPASTKLSSRSFAHLAEALPAGAPTDTKVSLTPWFNRFAFMCTPRCIQGAHTGLLPPPPTG